MAHRQRIARGVWLPAQFTAAPARVSDRSVLWPYTLPAQSMYSQGVTPSVTTRVRKRHGVLFRTLRSKERTAPGPAADVEILADDFLEEGAPGQRALEQTGAARNEARTATSPSQLQLGAVTPSTFLIVALSVTASPF